MAEVKIHNTKTGELLVRNTLDAKEIVDRNEGLFAHGEPQKGFRPVLTAVPKAENSK